MRLPWSLLRFSEKAWFCSRPTGLESDVYYFQLHCEEKRLKIIGYLQIKHVKNLCSTSLPQIQEGESLLVWLITLTTTIKLKQMYQFNISDTETFIKIKKQNSTIEQQSFLFVHVLFIIHKCIVSERAIYASKQITSHLRFQAYHSTFPICRYFWSQHYRPFDILRPNDSFFLKIELFFWKSSSIFNRKDEVLWSWKDFLVDEGHFTTAERQQ